MNRLFLIGLAICFLSVAGVGAQAAEFDLSKYEQSDFLSSEKIAKEGPIKIEAEGVGTVLIHSLTNTRAPEKSCMLLIPGLIESLNRDPVRAGVEIQVWLQTVQGRDSKGNPVTICIDGGNTCFAVVEVEG